MKEREIRYPQEIIKPSFPLSFIYAILLLTSFAFYNMGVFNIHILIVLGVFQKLCKVYEVLGFTVPLPLAFRPSRYVNWGEVIERKEIIVYLSTPLCWRNNLAGKALALHAADSDLIPSTPYG